MNDTAATTAAAVERLVQFFEGIAREDLLRLPTLYAPDARYKDPFSAVQGLAAIEAIYAHMFTAVDAPQFRITARIVQGAQCFLVWEFRFRFRQFQTRTVQTVHGATHFKFDAAGLITLHRDYWDAAEEVYEKLPGLGALLRWTKRFASPSLPG